jgi:hypothetical protein
MIQLHSVVDSLDESTHSEDWSISKFKTSSQGYILYNMKIILKQYYIMYSSCQTDEQISNHNTRYLQIYMLLDFLHIQYTDLMSHWLKVYLSLWISSHHYLSSGGFIKDEYCS